jgi:hypothetical protein
MPKQAVAKQKLYLYGIAPEFDGKIFGPIGLDKATAYSITSGRVSAVVSDVSEKLRPERRHLAAHQEVLKRMMAEAPAVLPVSFGVVLESVDALRRILSRTHNQTSLLAQLRRVEGRVEMALRVTWDVPNIFEYFVETHPELRAARDQFFTGHRQPSQDDKIEVGRMFDRLLTEDREAHAERVEDSIGPQCVEIKRNPVRNERQVANLACLVERTRQTEFEAAVLAAAQLFDNNYTFDYSGPWAPHNFVDMALDLRQTRTATQAQM